MRGLSHVELLAIVVTIGHHVAAVHVSDVEDLEAGPVALAAGAKIRNGQANADLGGAAAAGSRAVAAAVAGALGSAQFAAASAIGVGATGGAGLSHTVRQNGSNAAVFAGLAAADKAANEAESKLKVLQLKADAARTATLGLKEKAAQAEDAAKKAEEARVGVYLKLSNHLRAKISGLRKMACEDGAMAKMHRQPSEQKTKPACKLKEKTVRVPSKTYKPVEPAIPEDIEYGSETPKGKLQKEGTGSEAKDINGQSDTIFADMADLPE